MRTIVWSDSQVVRYGEGLLWSIAFHLLCCLKTALIFCMTSQDAIFPFQDLFCTFAYILLFWINKIVKTNVVTMKMRIEYGIDTIGQSLYLFCREIWLVATWQIAAKVNEYSCLICLNLSYAPANLFSLLMLNDL